jgi:hypothetical protein
VLLSTELVQLATPFDLVNLIVDRFVGLRISGAYTST